MLVSAKEMLTKAHEGKYAVGQFNINNLEWTKAILLTAEENRSPVILGVSEGAGKYMCGYKTVMGMVKGMIEEAKAQGLWTPRGGKTPEQTLYSAIIREIRDKGSESRFRKDGRGLFAFAK